MLTQLITMTPIIALFKKEFHQHGAFALAMVFLCLFLQIAYVEWFRFANYTIDAGFFFSIALLITMLYAGGAAALAYSTEHADNTFVFLRKLPISWTTIACGKAGWVFCGTVLVLIGNLLLYAVFTGTGYVSGAYNSGTIWIAVGVGIVEAFVWGLFWSTRCRSQIHALLTTYACASVMAFVVVHAFVEYSSDVTEMYANAFLYRLVAAGIVGIFAVWGMSRWFSFEVKQPLLARLYPDKMTLGYPQRVQQPFSALIHHHIRHASLLYPLGIFCMFAWVVGCGVICMGLLMSILFSMNVNNLGLSEDTIWWLGVFFGTGVYGSVLIMALFWATIFGHDQKNDSYRFLSRIGISDGAVWWSRMLPAMFCYVLVILGVAAVSCVNILHCIQDMQLGSARISNPAFNWQLFWDNLWLVAPVGFLIWLAPAAVGAFISISFRSQVVAISLVAGGLLLTLAWASLLLVMFGCSPWWTTVPICIALLIASRIRAGYWLRETFTWRSRILPLVPVFACMLAVMIAVPFVRVYSVPYISWEQIDAYFDQAEFDPQDTLRMPERRKALIRHIAEHGTVLPEHEIWLAAMEDRWRPKLSSLSGCTFEEYLLLSYVVQSDYWNRVFRTEYRRGTTTRTDDPVYSSTWLFPYMPWERARVERVLRLQIVARLVELGYIQDKKAVAIRHLFARNEYRQVVFDEGLWWLSLWHTNVRSLCYQQCDLVYETINKWYIAHDRTLPESLDELIEKGYLSAFPVHPFTGEQMQYFRNASPHEIRTNDYMDHDHNRYVRGNLLGISRVGVTRNDRWIRGNDTDEVLKIFRDTGGTFLQLGRWFYLIVEPEERSLESEDGSQEEEN